MPPPPGVQRKDKILTRHLIGRKPVIPFNHQMHIPAQEAQETLLAVAGACSPEISLMRQPRIHQGRGLNPLLTLPQLQVQEQIWD